MLPIDELVRKEINLFAIVGELSFKDGINGLDIFVVHRTHSAIGFG